MAKKDALDQIVEEIVVFKNPNGHSEPYFSNDPRFQDSRIRERWMSLYSDDAQDASIEEGEPEEEEVDANYEEWTNDDLRAELSNRGLSLDGKKADLVARLREDDATQED